MHNASSRKCHVRDARKRPLFFCIVFALNCNVTVLFIETSDLPVPSEVVLAPVSVFRIVAHFGRTVSYVITFRQSRASNDTDFGLSVK